MSFTTSICAGSRNDFPNGTEHVAIEGELAAVNRVELFQWPGRVPLPALARLRAACHVSNMSHSSPMTQRRAESLPFIIPQSNFEEGPKFFFPSFSPYPRCTL